MSSCQFFNKAPLGEPIARVNNSYLYAEDLKGLIDQNTTKEDSTLRVSNFINKWATQQLLLDAAQINLSEERQEDFEGLVHQYKTDLFTSGYKEALVKQKMDTSVTIQEANEVYTQNLETFQLDEALVKFRYINVGENNANIKDIEERLKRFDETDKEVLDSISIQFKSYSLNDSIWIRAAQAVAKIPVFNEENRKELLKKSNFIQLKDSLGLYLMQIKDVLQTNDTAPIEYVMPTIRQIVINKRKLEFIKELEKDITKDAVKNKQFEIYN
ncbi:MAG: peptidyl-prolyl cis-trans isomerase [Flavobacteriaceae bacterium]|nr:peptidyl-prolyl cis-trans isomerase [Flavobacteriaceae bacterium]